MSFTPESAELRHVRMRLKAPFETSFGVESDRECILLKLECDGAAGWGECVAVREPGYSYETVGTAWHVLTEFFLPAILGKELAGPKDLAGCLARYRGHPMARAAVELALWDVTGKLEGASLPTLLGGGRATVPVGVSVGIQPDLPALLAVVDQFLEEGYQRIKLKIKPGRDVAEVRAVRERHPETLLQVDANSAYSLAQANVFESLDDLNLLLIEQPFDENDLIDHSKLQARIQTPVCLDESILSARHAAQALEIDACRVINIKPARVGGLMEAVRIHDLCLEQGVPVWCGGMLETGIGRAGNLALASLTGFILAGDISATDRYYDRDVTKERFVLNSDSTINVPEGPGLGVNLDAKVLEEVTLRSVRIPA